MYVCEFSFVSSFVTINAWTVDRSLRALIEMHVPVHVPRRPAHGARMLDDRADLKLFINSELWQQSGAWFTAK